MKDVNPLSIVNNYQKNCKKMQMMKKNSNLHAQTSTLRTWCADLIETWSIASLLRLDRLRFDALQNESHS